MNTILIAFAVIIVLALIVFPGVRGKLKILVGGFLNLFVEDMAKTPEGAEAVYQEAIEDMQGKYNQASTVYNKLVGERSSMERKIERLKQELASTEQKCESLVRSGKMDDAKVFSERRAELLAEIKSNESYLKEIKPRVDEAKEIHAACEKRLRDLKREKTAVVNELILNGTMKGIFDDLDELKRVKDVDKLLGTVRDHRENLRKEVAGASEVHNNKASTKIQKAEANASAAVADDYLESLKTKYGSK